jgi:TPR repeat protein
MAASSSAPSLTTSIDETLPSCYAFTIYYDWTTLHQHPSVSSHTVHHDQDLLQYLLSIINIDVTTLALSSSASSSRDDRDKKRGEIMNNIGYIYLHGLFGSSRDSIKAVEWFNKSALLNDEFGCFNFDFMLHSGVCHNPPYYQISLNQPDYSFIVFIQRLGLHVILEQHINGGIVLVKPMLVMRKSVMPMVIGLVKNYSTIVNKYLNNIFNWWQAVAITMIIFVILLANVIVGIGSGKDYPKALEWWYKEAETTTNCDGWCAYAIGYHSIRLENVSLATKWLTKSMEYGNTLAAQRLADLYNNGAGMDGKDEKKALELMKWSAEQSLLPSHNKWISKAPFQLAEWYIHGICASKDYVMALKWFTVSSNQPNGNGHSEYYISVLYSKGEYGIEKDELKAFEWMLRSAQLNYHDALIEVARYHSDGIGTPVDYLEAMEWWMKASQRKDSSGISDNHIGRAYEDGNGVEKDEKEAVKWYLKGAQRGFAVAQYNLAQCYEDGKGVAKNDELAFQWMLRSALKGDTDALNQIGGYYYLGIGTRVDYEQAIGWWKKASLHHDTDGDADYYIGVAYSNGGYGVVKDAKEAVKWYLKSAEGDNHVAQYHLAKCYENGIGIEKNQQLSFKWMLESAQQNHGDALYWIGCYYRDGIGTPRNYFKYVEWFKKAMLHPDCTDSLATILVCKQCSCTIFNPIEDTSELVGDGSSQTMIISSMTTTEWSTETRAIHFEFGERLIMMNMHERLEHSWLVLHLSRALSYQCTNS